MLSQKPLDFLWDLWCAVSVVGIWPRFIEPKLLQTTHVHLNFSSLPPELNDLKIVQFSDLHFNKTTSPRFLKKLNKRVQSLNPDLLVFTGDFLCYSKLEDQERLRTFLNSFHAPYGCYAIFGNHDYQESVSVNEEGEYDVVSTEKSSLSKGLNRLIKEPLTPTGKITEKASQVGLHQELVQLISTTPFTLLHNKTVRIPINGSYLNICGLGEYMVGRSSPEVAFQEYDRQYPGIVLAHNPDGVPFLKNYPGELILSGHTHGAQINLPWFWKRFAVLENRNYIKGLFSLSNQRCLYVNRGVGSVFTFRWFAAPEITLFTFKKGR